MTHDLTAQPSTFARFLRLLPIMLPLALLALVVTAGPCFGEDPLNQAKAQLDGQKDNVRGILEICFWVCIVLGLLGIAAGLTIWKDKGALVSGGIAVIVAAVCKTIALTM